jgi:Fe-S cluster assembly iron-binding protein IscA
MLSVTFSAKEKLKANLQNEKKDEESLMRLGRSSTDPQQLGFLLDKEKEGDQVIMDNDGERLLLIGQDVAPVVDGLVLDYRETTQGTAFTIARSQTD